MFKTKKFVTVVAMFMVALLAFSACGGGKVPKANPASDFEYDFNEDGKSLYIKQYIGKGSTVVFPAEIEGYPVTRITRGVEKDVLVEVDYVGRKWYKNTNVKSVVISEGIEVIDNSAFQLCEALKSVTIPSTVKVIPDYAFRDCTSLTDVSIPASIEKIGFQAFDDCPLTNLKIPESVTSIKFDGSVFDGSQPPLAMRKRLQDLGYEGSF